MPTFSVVKRHIEELLGREPEHAEAIRALLPPPQKTQRKAAAKAGAAPVTEPPVTEPPTDTPPVTEPPTDTPPVTEPPVTEPA